MYLRGPLRLFQAFKIKKPEIFILRNPSIVDCYLGIFYSLLPTLDLGLYKCDPWKSICVLETWSLGMLINFGLAEV